MALASGMRFDGSTYGTIQDVTDTYSKAFGIYLMNCTNVTIDNCEIAYVDSVPTPQVQNSAGISINNGEWIQISNSNIHDIAADSSPRIGYAIAANTDHCTVQDNVVDNISPAAFCLWGAHHTIAHNTLTNCASMLDDQGSIYMGGGGDYTDTVVEHNKVSDMPGNLAGTRFDPATDNCDTVGIYIDEFASNLTVRGNLVSDCSYGVFLHYSHGVMVYNNTLYNNRDYSMIFAENGGGEDCMYGNVFKNNVCYCVGDTQKAVRINRHAGSTGLSGRWITMSTTTPARDQYFYVCTDELHLRRIAGTVRPGRRTRSRAPATWWTPTTGISNSRSIRPASTPARRGAQHGLRRGLHSAGRHAGYRGLRDEGPARRRSPPNSVRPPLRP